MLDDGRVLIIGGAISADQFDSWKYFPDSRVLLLDPERRKVTVAGHRLHSRYWHESMQLTPTTFVLFGGIGPSELEAEHGDYTTDVEAFDLSQGTSRKIGETLVRRYDFSAELLDGGKVLLCGGMRPREDFNSSRTAEIFDLSTGMSQKIGQLMPGIDGKSLVTRGDGPYTRAVSYGDKSALIGEFHACLYDWRRALAGMKVNGFCTPESEVRRDEARRNYHVIKVASGRVFLLGGDGWKVSTDGKTIEEFIRVGQTAEGAR